MSIAPLGIATAALLALTPSAFAQTAAGSLEPFPPAKAGMQRHVITFPEEADESALQVELLPGKMLEVDCNRVMISAQATTKTVEGWGYDFVVVDNVSQPVSTMMACAGVPKEKRFVTVNLGAESMRRYNSKLPLVVYAPEDVTVKYRIWRADGELHDAAIE